jgi:putative Ca2+/H+ antiporter (TMEM165/GDT1 family)
MEGSMELKTLLVVFVTVFLAELGDKTQLATLLFATDGNAGRMTVFAGASLALVASSAVAVLAGSLLSSHLDGRLLGYGAGALFIVIGVWTIVRA